MIGAQRVSVWPHFETARDSATPRRTVAAHQAEHANVGRAPQTARHRTWAAHHLEAFFPFAPQNLFRPNTTDTCLPARSGDYLRVWDAAVLSIRINLGFLIQDLSVLSLRRWRRLPSRPGLVALRPERPRLVRSHQRHAMPTSAVDSPATALVQAPAITCNGSHAGP